MVQKVKALYDLRPQVNHLGSKIFAMPISDRIKTSTRQLQIWTTQFTPVIVKAVNTTQLQIFQGMKDIHYYLSPPSHMRQPNTTTPAKTHLINTTPTQLTNTEHVQTQDSDEAEASTVRKKKCTKIPHKEKTYKEVLLETLWSRNST